MHTRPFWISRSGKFRPPFEKRRRSLFFNKYPKLPKTAVKRYLQKIGHGIMVFDGGHFGFHALENSARLLKRGVGAFF